ncbi:MAG: sugar diacid recognition domain-containing protein [Tissierellia bacterium]|nr:sugar diacid recognition domain-containing protein [Tissierellia bacterium]
MILQETAQHIVDQTMDTIPYNINIMDEEGIIIASGKSERIGSFHERAYRVIKTGLTIETSQQEIENQGNIEPGISLPILFNARIIGSVGITGHPDEVRVFGELVKKTVELMLQQSILKDRLHFELFNKIQFLQEVLTGESPLSEELFAERSRQFRLSIEGNLLLVTARVADAFTQTVKKETYSTMSGSSFGNLIQPMRFANFGIHPSDINICFIGSYLTFMISLKDAKHQKNRRVHYRIAEILYEELTEKDFIRGAVCYSGICTKREQIPREYKRNIDLQRFSELHPSGKVVSMETHILDFIVSSIEADVGESLVASYCDGINQDEEYSLQLEDTLKSYYQHDMNITNTSKALFIHRNTLHFRLERIHILCGLNPKKFEDSVKLYLIQKYVALRTDTKS